MSEVKRGSVKEKLEEAQSKVKAGEKYVHYRSPEKPYVVLSVALLEATEEPCVVYQSTNDGLIWVRPLHSFLEQVDVSGKRQARFQKIC